MPTPQEMYRRRYREKRPGWRPSWDVYHELIRRHSIGAARVLEIGCGHKGFPSDFLRGGTRRFGVDPDVDALRSNASVVLRAASPGERLPFKDGSFDLACCSWVLEHVDEPQSFMNDIARVLAPGGSFIFVTPNGLNPVTWIIRAVPNRLHPSIMRRLQHRDVTYTYPVRYRINTPRALERIMGAAGFVRESLTMNGDPTYVAAGPATFRVAAAAERVFDIPALQRARIHLLGVYRKS